MSAGRNWGELIAPQPLPMVASAARTVGPKREGLAYQRLYEWRDYPTEPPKQQYRDDPTDIESPLLERDAPWWTPRCIGFAARILVNPLGGEVRYETQAYIAYLQGRSTEEEHLKAIADRVVEWEYVQIDDDGARVPIEPPAVGGWERFLDLPNDALIWLKEEVRTAHLPKATTTRSTKPAGSTGEVDPMMSDPEPEPQAS